MTGALDLWHMESNFMRRRNKVFRRLFCQLWGTLNMHLSFEE